MTLCAALVAASFATALHAFEHDLDAVDGMLCLVCIPAGDLGDACLYSSPSVPVEPPGFVNRRVCTATFFRASVVAVRERGPPASA